MSGARRTAVVLLLAAGTTAVAGAAILSRRGPVLLDITPDPAMVRPRNYVIMNPFRDRAPERPAEEFLEALRDGDMSVLAAVGPSYGEQETKWPIRRWRIGRWERAGDRLELMYWVRRGNGYGSTEEEVHLTVDGGRVVSFSAVY